MFYDAQSRHTDDETDENRMLMCTQRSRYRKVCRLKRKEYNISEARRLFAISRSNPKLFWKEVKSKSGKNKGRPPENCDFFTHFKNLAGRDSNISDEGRDEMNMINRDMIETFILELDKEITLEELNNAISKLKL